MPIIDRKEWAPGPEIYLLKLGLDYVQYDWNSVLIVISNHTLVSVSCISDNYSVFLRCKFGWIIILSELHDLFVFHLHVFFALADSHFHTTVLNDIIWTQILFLFFPFSLFFCFLRHCRQFIWFLLRVIRLRFDKRLFEAVQSILNYRCFIFIFSIQAACFVRHWVAAVVAFMRSKKFGSVIACSLGESRIFRALRCCLILGTLIQSLTLFYLVGFIFNFIKWGTLEASKFVESWNGLFSMGANGWLSNFATTCWLWILCIV